MADKFRAAFFAFPGEPNDLFATIVSAAETAARASEKISITTWPEMTIFGAALADEDRNHIRNTDVVVCDITRPNLNVYYEIGFAIGLGKPIAPVINTSFANATQDVLKDGFSRYRFQAIRKLRAARQNFVRASYASPVGVVRQAH